MSKRKRKSNPKNNHSGLGAFIGSAALATTTVIVSRAIRGKQPAGAPMSPVVTAATTAASIVGGALGGHYGAKSDRRRRGAIGGAVGGVLGPIGAAVGGWVGGRKADSRRKNPTPLALQASVGTGAAALGTTVGLVQARRARTRTALHPAQS